LRSINEKRGKHRPTSGASLEDTVVAPPTRPTQQRKVVKEKGWFRRYWWTFVLVPLAAILGGFLMILFVYANTKLPDAPPGPQTTFVLDRNGKLITTLHAEVNRVVVPFDQIPDVMKNAVIAAEDKDFYHHGGVSYFSIIRAGWADLTHGRIEQGGSTITQQYVKNVYTGNKRTFGRKIKEAILAVKVDHKYSKDEILGRYLNTVYFGNGAYGVQAAAQMYFGIPARKLNLLQAAALAAVIPAPAVYDPVDHPDAAKVRRNSVLQKMADQGYITQEEADSLQDEPVKVRLRPEVAHKFAYFVSVVSKALQDTYGYAETFTGGLRVTTTLDSRMQRAAEQAVASHLPAKSDPAAALVAIDPRTGAIRAMVGGRDFTRAKFNLATQAHRQAGSAFKPFTLAAAMEQKISLKSMWQGPSEITIDDPRCANPDGTPWNVHNYADEESGTFELTDATAHSVNTIFAQLVVAVDPTNVVDMAERMGIRSELQPVCSITLGTQPVSPLDMTTSYATLAARGVLHSPFTVAAVKSTDDHINDTYKPKEGERALRRNDADLVTFALQAVVERGTGTAADIGRPVAGKTGTAQKFVDAWFCGYTPQLAACVWVGYPKGEIPMENVEGYSSVFGGSIPAAIWHDFMSAAMQGQPVVDFPEPSFEGYDEFPEGAISSPEPAPSPSPKPPPPPPPSVEPSPSESPPPEPSPSVSVSP
jgi:1A family penicillin-binding protein